APRRTSVLTVWVLSFATSEISLQRNVSIGPKSGQAKFGESTVATGERRQPANCLVLGGAEPIVTAKYYSRLVESAQPVFRTGDGAQQTCSPPLWADRSGGTMPSSLARCS